MEANLRTILAQAGQLVESLQTKSEHVEEKK